MNLKESNIYKRDKVFIVKEGSNVCWLKGIAVEGVEAANLAYE